MPGMPLIRWVLLVNLLLSSVASAGAPTRVCYLPIVVRRPSCQPIPGEVYSALPVIPPPTSLPAEVHPDLNLAVRGMEESLATPTLVEYGGAADPGAPQLATLFFPYRRPVFVCCFQVYDWDWANMRRGAAIAYPPATAMSVSILSGEVLRLPVSGYDIGDGFAALVLYAAPDAITLKYTREDNVVHGFTLHLSGVCVSPDLLELFRQCDRDGRASLPALRHGQAFGRAEGDTLILAVRDTGSFMDPRSRRDWWRDYSLSLPWL